jgi:hypothetical protein
MELFAISVIKLSLRRWSWAIASIALSTTGASVASAADVRVSVSSREAYVGLPFTLQVEISDATAHEPPVLPDIPGATVESLGTPSVRSQTTIINGQQSSTSSLTYAWRITPRQEGKLVVPSFSVQVEGQAVATQSIEVEVQKNSTGDLLLAEVTSDKQSVYVGEALELTLKIWLKPFADKSHDVTLSEGDMWSCLALEQSSWGVFVERLQELLDAGRRPRGEKAAPPSGGTQPSHYLYEIEATIYPQRSGPLDIGEIQIVASYPTGLTLAHSIFGGARLAVSGRRPLVALVAATSTEVRDIPTDNRPADYQGAVGQYQIAADAIPTAVQAGDPITLHLGIAGQGQLETLPGPALAKIPELTRDFRVPDEPLAGVVDNGVKSFTVSIRPRDASVTQIPAIPFTYFDPAQGVFATARTQPIPITVKPVETLSLDSLAGADDATSQADAASALQSESALQIARGPDLLRSREPASSWAIASALCFGPLVFVGTALLSHLRGAQRALQPRHAARDARRALHAAKTAGEVSAAMLGYAGQRLGIAAQSLTRTEAVEQLRSDDVREGLDELDELLAQCERSRYSGGSGTAAQDLVQSGLLCIDRLERRAGS